ncbi:hypothetical protein [Polyangium mundeleinium]|uniref:Uncharacterized protein n=1 Tax=Polyangium mundeleinium TaxID=2995306 RepID=A0ABT5EW18_9BACT|nr:hypothetical protein [Polyangium mundeleinium]MDC0745614.1 hypothetical protein [Polyangium mundeleinium]
MTKRWNVIWVIFGSLAAMGVGCDANDPADEGTVRSTSDEVGEAWGGTPIGDVPGPPRGGCRGFHCASELPPGRCIYDRDCPFACVFPADGCDAGLDECLGYCLAGDQCISDLSCAGGQRCLDCAVSPYSAACVEVCEPIVPLPPPPPIEPPPPPPPVEPPPVVVVEPPPPPVEPPPVVVEPPVQEPPVQEPPVQEPPVQAPPVQEPPVQAPPPPPPPKDDCPNDKPPKTGTGGNGTGQQSQLPPAPPPPPPASGSDLQIPR